MGQTLAFDIPQPLKAGHHELYSRLEDATSAGGKTGEAAKKAMSTLRGHFEKEERYALPQLGTLVTLAGMPGQAAARLSPEQRQDLIERTERFRRELPQMLKEHQEISAALKDLEQAARSEGKQQVTRLAEEITTHAKTEEQVLYPAALLIGDYIRATEQAKR